MIQSVATNYNWISTSPPPGGVDSVEKSLQGKENMLAKRTPPPSPRVNKMKCKISWEANPLL